MRTRYRSRWSRCSPSSLRQIGSAWPAGQTIADVIARIPAIESALGAYRPAVRVYPTRDGKANRCELRILGTDPHADAVP